MSTRQVDLELVEKMSTSALEAYNNSYCPYSKYKVGAAILTKDGTIFNGCNIENCTYTLTLHAEQTAIGNAITKGQRVFQALFVMSKDGQATPCGICRQMLYEHAETIPIYTIDPQGQIVHHFFLNDLLPHAFGPHNLKC